MEPEGKYFNYQCGGETAIRTCYARPKLADYPVLEFHMQNVGDARYLGKHWCQVAQSVVRTEKATALCRAVGQPDPEMTSGVYYLINN